MTSYLLTLYNHAKLHYYVFSKRLQGSVEESPFVSQKFVNVFYTYRKTPVIKESTRTTPKSWGNKSNVCWR